MAYQLIREYSQSAVEDFRSLKGKGGHFEKGLFIAEGEKVTRKVLESKLEIRFGLHDGRAFRKSA